MACAISYEKVITTKPFTFIVGSERTLMIVHSGMVSHHSAVLQKLVDGDMAEATSRVATLVDVDPGTFARFSQWGYTGDYTAVQPEILLDSSMIGTEQPNTEAKPDDLKYDDVPMVAPAEVAPSPAPEPEGWGSYEGMPAAFLRRKKGGPSYRKYYTEMSAAETSPPPEAPSMTRKETAWFDFRTLNLEKSNLAETRSKVQELCEDYTEVFLCHARLYVFAEKYDIEPLRKLSKQKIHQTLIGFHLYTERVGDIVVLLRYVYANTPDRDGATDELRELVMKYIVCQYDKMAPSEEFLDLMEEGGTCVRDCLSMLSGIVN